MEKEADASLPLFCVGKPLSLLRRQGRVAAPSIRCALLASCWPLPQQRLPVSATGGGRRCCPCRGEPLAGRAALSWTLEAQYGAKGRALLQRAAASGQCTLSSCRWLGQQGTTVHETDKLCSSRGNLTDMPRALPLGELASVARLRGRGRYLRSAFEIVPRRKRHPQPSGCGCLFAYRFNGQRCAPARA